MASPRSLHPFVGLAVSLTLLSACGFLSTPEPLPTLFVPDASTGEALESIDSGPPTLPPSWTPAAEPIIPATAIPEGQATPQATSGGNSPVTISNLGNGWMLYEIAFGNYAIALPQDWVYVDIRPEMWAASSDLLAEIVPEGAAYVEGRLPAYFAYGVDFIAYIETVQSGSRAFYSNVVVFSEFTGQRVSLSDITDEDLDAIAALFGTESFTHGRVGLPAGEAERMEYTLTITSVTGEEVTATGIAYVLVENSYTYIIEFATTADQIGGYRPTFQQVVESFRLLQ